MTEFQYLSLNKYNNSDVKVPMVLENQRNTSILNQGEDYYCSIVKFSIDNTAIPIYIPKFETWDNNTVMDISPYSDCVLKTSLQLSPILDATDYKMAISVTVAPTYPEELFTVTDAVIPATAPITAGWLTVSNIKRDFVHAIGDYMIIAQRNGSCAYALYNTKDNVALFTKSAYDRYLDVVDARIGDVSCEIFDCKLSPDASRIFIGVNVVIAGIRNIDVQIVNISNQSYFQTSSAYCTVATGPQEAGNALAVASSTKCSIGTRSPNASIRIAAMSSNAIPTVTIISGQSWASNITILDHVECSATSQSIISGGIASSCRIYKTPNTDANYAQIANSPFSSQSGADAITCVAISPDGYQIILGTASGKLICIGKDGTTYGTFLNIGWSMQSVNWRYFNCVGVQTSALMATNFRLIYSMNNGTTSRTKINYYGFTVDSPGSWTGLNWISDTVDTILSDGSIKNSFYVIDSNSKPKILTIATSQPDPNYDMGYIPNVITMQTIPQSLYKYDAIVATQGTHDVPNILISATAGPLANTANTFLNYFTLPPCISYNYQEKLIACGSCGASSDNLVHIAVYNADGTPKWHTALNSSFTTVNSTNLGGVQDNYYNMTNYFGTFTMSGPASQTPIKFSNDGQYLLAAYNYTFNSQICVICFVFNAVSGSLRYYFSPSTPPVASDYTRNNYIGRATLAYKSWNIYGRGVMFGFSGNTVYYDYLIADSYQDATGTQPTGYLSSFNVAGQTTTFALSHSEYGAVVYFLDQNNGSQPTLAFLSRSGNTFSSPTKVVVANIYDIAIDYFGNYYMLYSNKVEKRQPNGTLLATLTLPTGGYNFLEMAPVAVANNNNLAEFTISSDNSIYFVSCSGTNNVFAVVNIITTTIPSYAYYTQTANSITNGPLTNSLLVVGNASANGPLQTVSFEYPNQPNYPQYAGINGEIDIIMNQGDKTRLQYVSVGPVEFLPENTTISRPNYPERRREDVIENEFFHVFSSIHLIQLFNRTLTSLSNLLPQLAAVSPQPFFKVIKTASNRTNILINKNLPAGVEMTLHFNYQLNNAVGFHSVKSALGNNFFELITVFDDFASSYDDDYYYISELYAPMNVIFPFTKLQIETAMNVEPLHTQHANVIHLPDLNNDNRIIITDYMLEVDNLDAFPNRISYTAMNFDRRVMLRNSRINDYKFNVLLKTPDNYTFQCKMMPYTYCEISVVFMSAGE